MKKTLTLFAVVVVGAVLAGCLHQNLNKQTSQLPAQNQITGSFYDLIGMGRSMECRWEASDEEGKTTGVSYVDGERARVEASFADADSGETTTYNSIVADGFFYGWNTGEETGIKMKQPEVDPEMADEAMPEQPEGFQGQNLDQEVDFDCQPWNVDEFKFTPPSDIEFEDFTAQMEKAQQMMESMQNQSDDLPNPEELDLCSICASIPDAAARNECLSSCQ